jgi:hypothetical protein
LLFICRESTHRDESPIGGFLPERMRSACRCSYRQPSSMNFVMRSASQERNSSVVGGQCLQSGITSASTPGMSFVTRSASGTPGNEMSSSAARTSVGMDNARSSASVARGGIRKSRAMSCVESPMNSAQPLSQVVSRGASSRRRLDSERRSRYLTRGRAIRVSPFQCEPFTIPAGTRSASRWILDGSADAAMRATNPPQLTPKRLTSSAPTPSKTSKSQRD